MGKIMAFVGFMLVALTATGDILTLVASKKITINSATAITRTQTSRVRIFALDAKIS